MSEIRLIDANALKERLAKHQSILNFEWNYDNLIASIIDNAPTVAVDEEIERQREELYQSSKKLFDTARMLGVERPKGEWKLIRVADHCGIHDSFVCPFCNYEREYRKKNFCEECGADLRGDNNGKSSNRDT